MPVTLSFDQNTDSAERDKKGAKRSWVWLLYLLAGVPAMITYYSLPSPTAQNMFNILTDLYVVAAFVAGVLLHRPSYPLPWYLFAIGLALMIPGDVVILYSEYPYTSLVDALYLVATPCLAAAFLLLGRGGIGRKGANLIDPLILSVGIGMLLWVLFVKPEVHGSTYFFLERMVPLGFLLAYVVLIAILIPPLFMPAKRLPALYLLSSGIAIYAIADFAFGHGWSILAGYQSYAPGSPVTGGWILAIALFGAGALHPSMAFLSKPAPAPKAKLTYERLMLLTGATLMAPGVMVVQATIGQPIDVPLIAGGSVLLFLLMMARLAGMIAEHRRAEEEIKEANQHLQELAVLKADFTRMIAHEFGGPLGAIRRLKEMLSAEGSDSEIRSYATVMIEAEIDTLDMLVADVRSAGEVERDDFKVALRPVSLATLLRSAEAYTKTLPDEHPVEFVVNGELSKGTKVRADPERVGQVLRNLLSNAAKYSPPGMPIEVRTVRDRGTNVRIEVADRGSGIPPEDLVRIFEKFARGRNQKYRKAAGVGLGLYLSRRIVQSHGSDLAVSSILGTGSVFMFELELVP